MRTPSRQSRYRAGSITVEFSVALAVMLLIFSLVINTLYQVGKTNRGQWARRQCLHGARAQLDSFTAVGRAIDEQTWQKLWPHTECAVRQTPGEDEWKGLTRVEVTVRRRINGRDIKTTARRYISRKETD